MNNQEVLTHSRGTDGNDRGSARRHAVRGGEIVGRSLLVEIDEIEPIGMASATDEVNAIESDIVTLLVQGRLGVVITEDGLQASSVDADTASHLRELGRRILVEQGIDPEEFRAVSFVAGEEVAEAG